MNLENLVPPLELCKKIPQYIFPKSIFVYIKRINGVEVMTRSRYAYLSHLPAYNAPTMQEIMAAIPYCRIYKKKRGNFVAVHEKIRVYDSNGATAALKLWLKLKVIDNEE